MNGYEVTFPHQNYEETGMMNGTHCRTLPAALEAADWWMRMFPESWVAIKPSGGASPWVKERGSGIRFGMRYIDWHPTGRS